MQEAGSLPHAILASQLLQTDTGKSRNRGHQSSFLTGIKSIDAQFRGLFCPGKVIGLGAIVLEGKGLTAHLIAKHLLQKIGDQNPKAQQQKQSPETGGQADVFIIAPPSSDIISSVHHLVEAHLNKTRPTPTGSHTRTTTTTTTEQDSLHALEPIQLLQYLDFAGLIESLSEVSDRLFAQGQRTNEDIQQQQASECVVLLLQGVDSAISTVLRRNGVVHANALLINLMRQLCDMSRRSHTELLVLLDLNIEIAVRGGDTDRGSTGSTTTNNSRLGTSNDGEIVSAFSSVDGGVMRLMPRGVVGSVLEKAVDTLVVTHNGFSKDKGASFKDRHVTIVEVVKDRDGTLSGQWAIWEDVHAGWT